MSRFFRNAIPFLVFVAIPFLSMADPGTPCDNSGGGTITDPLDETNCPLDTWVYLLVFLALVAGIWYIRKNRKSLFV